MAKTTIKQIIMNARRRKTIAAIIAALEDLQPTLDEVAEEEREAYDNLPDSLQDSERGWSMSASADCLDEAVSSFAEVLAQLEEAIEQ